MINDFARTHALSHYRGMWRAEEEEVAGEGVRQVRVAECGETLSHPTAYIV